MVACSSWDKSWRCFLRKGCRIHLSLSPAPLQFTGSPFGRPRLPETQLTHRVLPSELLSETSAGALEGSAVTQLSGAGGLFLTV